VIAQAVQARGAEEVRAALERAYAHPELAPDEPGLFERGLEALFDALPSFDADPAAAWTLLAVVGVALALLGGWLVVRLLASATPARGADEPAGGAGAPLDVGARLAELRARAAAARRAGDLRLALRLSFFALLVALSRRGDLELREAWTHREMLARGRTSARARAALEPWLGELDAKLFGPRDVTADDLEWFDGLSARLLEREAGGAA